MSQMQPGYPRGKILTYLRVTASKLRDAHRFAEIVIECMPQYDALRAQVEQRQHLLLSTGDNKEVFQSELERPQPLNYIQTESVVEWLKWSPELDKILK